MNCIICWLLWQMSKSLNGHWIKWTLNWELLMIQRHTAHKRFMLYLRLVRLKSFDHFWLVAHMTACSWRCHQRCFSTIILYSLWKVCVNSFCKNHQNNIIIWQWNRLFYVLVWEWYQHLYSVCVQTKKHWQQSKQRAYGDIREGCLWSKSIKLTEY